MLEVVKKLDDFAKLNKLTRAELAQKLGIPVTTVKHWFGLSEHRTDPSPAIQERIKTLVDQSSSRVVQAPTNGEAEQKRRALRIGESEALHRARKIRMLLILLEDELRWFQPDERRSDREVFREQLNAFDIGYISSLLSMLTEEEKYQRWKAFTSYRFKEFRR